MRPNVAGRPCFPGGHTYAERVTGASDTSSTKAAPSLPVRWANWLFRSRTDGKITVAQFPNLALGIFLACLVIGFALGAFAADASGLRSAVDVIGTLALIWWALDELIRGVNPWRRGLGLVVLAFVGGGLIRGVVG